MWQQLKGSVHPRKSNAELISCLVLKTLLQERLQGSSKVGHNHHPRFLHQISTKGCISQGLNAGRVKKKNLPSLSLLALVLLPHIPPLKPSEMYSHNRKSNILLRLFLFSSLLIFPKCKG